MSRSFQARRELPKLAVGGALWVAYAGWSVPHLLDEAWARALIVLAALVLLPLAWPLADLGDEPEGLARLGSWARALQFPAALLLAWSFCLPQGLLAAALAVPWCAVLILQALRGLAGILRSWQTASRLASSVGLTYGAIGAAWTLADRTGFRPLGFDPAIVLLTSAHFHVAGVVLPLIAGCACARLSSRGLATALAWFVAAGVLLVAVGITASRLNASHAIEAAAAVTMSFSGLVVAIVQLRMATERSFSFGAQLCLGLSGCALVLGMSLSALYGLRFAAQPLPWLDIPWMRALHGTANAIGFGLFGALGWRLSPQARSA